MCAITVRTEGANVSLEILKKEINKLYDEFENIDKKMKYSLGLKKVYGEDLSLTKILMNSSYEEVTKIHVDNEMDFEKISHFIKGEENFKLEKYEGYRNLFDFYGLEKELLKLTT